MEGRSRKRLRAIASISVVAARGRDGARDAGRSEALRGLSGGADLLCDPGTPDALIYKELLGRSQGREVAPELCQQLAGPLAAAARQTIQAMTGVEVAFQSVHGREAAGGSWGTSPRCSNCLRAAERLG